MCKGWTHHLLLKVKDKKLDTKQLCSDAVDPTRKKNIRFHIFKTLLTDLAFISFMIPFSGIYAVKQIELLWLFTALKPDCCCSGSFITFTSVVFH